MPTTYNGIGTHYYGKRNFEERVGDCRICGRTVNLRSYDTRLWFVVLFVPVIPMGRKRIVDFCPACTRHYAVDADKWETAKQLNISGALEKFRAAPTPENAIEAHQQMIAYHQGAQAADFQQSMTAQFPDNAKIQTYLGYVLLESAKPDQAASLFERALQLRPDLPEAKVGLARVHLRANRLDSARKLLSFLETPGAGQLYSLEPLETLANAYQGREQHAEALDLYGKLLAALPAVGEHRGFRQRVQKSEKALKRESSILPKAKFNWRKLFQYQRTGVPTAQFRFTRRGLAIAGGFALVAAIILALVNDKIRRHRTLHVVSGFKEPVTITVAGLPPVRLRSGEQELVLPEGHYHATVTGALREEVDFDIRAAGYFSRFFDDPAWLLNVGGSALIIYRQVTYSHTPRPPALRFYYGRAFEYIPNITHPFKDLPDTVYLKKSEERTYTQLELLREPPVRVFYHYSETGNGAEALRLAEWHLRLEPDDEQMLNGYARQAEKLKQAARAEAFLRAGLSNRPVLVEWHREYQQLCRKRGDEAQLADEYGRMLALDPTNSSLVYLRGRTCTNESEALTWFERARALDPANPFPNYALGYHHLSAGDWAKARPFLVRACQLRPDDDSFHYWLWLTQLALGEFSALEKDLRDRLRRDPLDLYSAVQLAEVLIAAGKEKEAARVASEFDRAALARPGKASKAVTRTMRRTVLYLSGDFAELEKYARTDKSTADRNALFHALVEQGRVAEAEKLIPPDEYNIEREYDLLALSIAWAKAGDNQKANFWLERAVNELEAGDRIMMKAAALLRSAEPPKPEALAAITVTPKSKAVLAAALAVRHPSHAQAYCAVARNFNVDRTYPFHLVRQVTASTK